MSYAAIVVGIGTLGYGIYSKARANKKTKDALAQRKAYQTPDEIYQILNALENRSQGDTITRDYQTQQVDNAFSQQLGVAELLGADPNDLSGMFNQKMQGILQVGQQFHQSNMEAFGKYIGALDMVASNKTGEWKSQQDIVKDTIQAAAADGQAANSTINSGINTILAGYSTGQSNKLYKQYLDSQSAGNNGFSNSTITDAIQPLSGTVQSNTITPQRTVGTGLQTINQNASTNYMNDAGFLQWLQNNGMGTKL